LLLIGLQVSRSDTVSTPIGVKAVNPMNRPLSHMDIGSENIKDEGRMEAADRDLSESISYGDDTRKLTE